MIRPPLAHPLFARPSANERLSATIASACICSHCTHWHGPHPELPWTCDTRPTDGCEAWSGPAAVEAEIGRLAGLANEEDGL